MELLNVFHSYGDWGLLALRVALASVFFVHGKMKWAMWKMSPSGEMPQGMLSLMRFLSVVEPLGAMAILLGFLSEFVAMGFAVIMIGAIIFKMKLWKVPFAGANAVGWEFDLVILAAALAVMSLGAGGISLDRFLWRI